MKNKLTAWILALALLLLAGCRLAQEPSEQENAEKPRFVGVYVVREDDGAQLDRSGWVEYGTIQADSELGKLEIPREILIAQVDRAADTITFPGLKGAALFAYIGATESGSPYTSFCSDMCDARYYTKVTKAGDSYDLSGTLYYGPPADDPDYDPERDARVWHHYLVFQMADGTIYLDGSGDAHTGGRGTTLTQTETSTVTVNGEEMEYYTRVEVKVEYVERLVSLNVRQYGADGELLGTQELPVEGEIPAVRWLSGADWLVVEETRGGELIRTAYDRPDEGKPEITHILILLDEDGVGYDVPLTIQ